MVVISLLLQTLLIMETSYPLINGPRLIIALLAMPPHKRRKINVSSCNVVDSLFSRMRYDDKVIL